MKINTKLQLLAFAFTVVSTQPLLAQTKADVFEGSAPITFLGVDISATKFIGAATNTQPTVGVWGFGGTKDNGPVSNDDFKNTFAVEWNQLFIDEEKKYNLAKAVHRESVTYAIDVAVKTDKALKRDFFSNNPSDFKHLNEDSITNLVKNYNFQNTSGIGLIFFIEGMSKGEVKEGVWVTFVDIKSKTVLSTTYKEEKPAGFGFKNYWAKPLYLIIRDMESNFKKWGR